MGIETREEVSEKIDNYIESGTWDVLHDHTETTPDGELFRMVALHAVTNEGDEFLTRREQVVLHATPFWSSPIRIWIEYPPGGKPEASVSWSSGGSLPVPEKEIAWAMVAMWSWVYAYMEGL